MNTITRIVGFAKIVRHVKNWQDVLMLYFGKKGNANINFRNGISLEVKKKDIPAILALCGFDEVADEDEHLLLRGLKVQKTDIAKITRAVRFLRKGGKLEETPQGIVASIGEDKFLVGGELDGVSELPAIYYEGVYGHLDPQGKKVLDIGAYIGDTAVWFLGKGAKRVIAYEPYTPMFDLAVQNVSLNHGDDSVEVHNCGVGKEEKTVKLNVTECFAANRIEMGKGHTAEEAAEIAEIQIASIKDVLESAGGVDAIKMNCEGSEYEILEAIAQQGLTDAAGGEIIVAIHNLDGKRNVGYAKELLRACGYTQMETVAKCSEESITIYAKKG